MRPDITLIYESGTIATKPDVLPLSIGDGELCETALTTVSVPEMFRYWLQGGRITVGFLGGAQIDRFANLNTTVVGALRQAEGAAARRRRRAGDRQRLRRDLHHHGAGRRAASSRSSTSSPRSATARAATTAPGWACKTKGPTRLITDLCDLRARSRDQGDDGHLDPSRRDARADRRPTPAGRCASPPTSTETPPPTDRRARRAARPARAHRARARRGGVRARCTIAPCCACPREAVAAAAMRRIDDLAAHAREERTVLD